MSAAPIPAAEEPAHSGAGFFSLPANRWDLIKFFMPLLIGVAWGLITLYFTQQAQGREQGDQAGKVQRCLDMHEAEAARLSVLESKVEDLRAGQKEMGADIKTVLQRL